MISTAQLAHDLAIAFVNYKLSLSISESEEPYTEEEIYELYKSAYRNYYDL